MCAARDAIFFSDANASFYAVKKVGGSIASVTSSMAAPRGCVFDRENTVYVADTEGNAVYSMPAGFVQLRAVRHIFKAYEVDSPSQVALYMHGSAHRGSLMILVSLAIFFTCQP